MPSIDPSLREEEYNSTDPYLNLQLNNNTIRKVDLYVRIQQGIDEAVGSTVEAKCCRRGCKVKGAQLRMCSGIDFSKFIHTMCYHYVENCNKNMPLLPAPVAVCTKRCHQKYIRGLRTQASVEGVDLPCHKDGRLGENDTNTSMSISMDWWTSEGKYSKYRGKNNCGLTKKTITNGLAIVCSKVS